MQKKIEKNDKINYTKTWGEKPHQNPSVGESNNQYKTMVSFMSDHLFYVIQRDVHYKL